MRIVPTDVSGPAKREGKWQRKCEAHLYYGCITGAGVYPVFMFTLRFLCDRMKAIYHSGVIPEFITKFL
jgi:hypothetical protein